MTMYAVRAMIGGPSAEKTTGISRVERMRIIHSTPANPMAMRIGPKAQNRTAPNARGANTRIKAQRITTAVWQTCPTGDCGPVQTLRILRLLEWWFTFGHTERDLSC